MSEKTLSIVEPSSPSIVIYSDPRRTALANDPFEPQTMSELFKFAENVSSTDFAPKEFKGKPNDCFVAMVYGRGLGLGALQSLQGVCVINGKPSVYGETFWAVILSHPDFVDCQEDVTEEKATVTITRKGRSAYTASFSMEDAKVAGLRGKAGPWTQYPKGQLLWRARHRVAVAVFADALKGVLPREVAIDYIDGGKLEVMPSPPALSAEAATAAPADAKRGDQPAPQEGKERTITPEEAKQWNDAFKAAGWSATDKRNYLTSIGVQRSGEMTLSQFNQAMEDCKAGPPNAAAEPLVAKDDVKTRDENPSDVEATKETGEQMANRWMTELGMGMFDRDRLIGRHTKEGVTDWGGVCLALEPDATRKGLA